MTSASALPEIVAERVGERGPHLERAAHVHPRDAARRGEAHGAGDERDRRAALRRARGDREAHAPARAVAEEADGIEVLERRPRRDDDALAGEIARAERRGDRAHDVLGLRHPPQPRLARRDLARDRPDQRDLPGERGDVALRRRVRPHARVHRRRREHRPLRAQRERGHHVVRAPVREAREHVGGRRHDRDHVRACGEIDVHLAGEARIPHVRHHPLARQARQRERPEEALRRRRHHRQDVRPRLHAQPRDVRGLVRGDAAGHAECDGSMRQIHDHRSSTGRAPG